MDLKKVIIPYGSGQTCNQLLHIAHWIPTANELGLPVYFPGFQRYADLFVGTANQRLPRYPRTAPDLKWPLTALLQGSWRFARVRPRTYTIGLIFQLARWLPGVVTFACDDSGRTGGTDPGGVLAKPQIAAGQSLWVRGWLYRDRPGVSRHRQCIKDFLAPVPEIQQQVDSYIRRNRERNRVLVGVHLRRGDYRRFEGGQFCYNDDVFRALMQQTLAALPGRRVRFLLMSNEPVCLKNYAGLDVSLGPGGVANDLYSLAACDYLIGPPSTFTIWASLYGSVPLYMINDPSAPLQLDCFRVRDGAYD